LQVRQLICCGTAKLLRKVARDAMGPAAGASKKQQQESHDDDDNNDGGDGVGVDEGGDGAPSSRSWFKVVNTLRHPLLRLKEEGYEVVGLEQTAASTSLYDFRFARKTVIVVGSENKGIPPNILSLCDRGTHAHTHAHALVH
jgi:hypothetical protein